MSDITTELLVILLLLLVNGVFAMSEIAVVASRKIRLEQRAEKGDKGAAAALALAQDPGQFLSTVQVGITLVGILAGAFGGVMLSGRLAAMLIDAGIPAPHATTAAFVIVVGAITYLSLIVGELVPKRIALAAPERIASRIARPMGVLSRVTAPLVKTLTGSTNVMLRLLGVRPHAEPGITEEEIRAVLEQGAETGVVQPAEREIVESVFRLGDRTVRAIMTPRPEVEWIDLSDDDSQADVRIRQQLAEDRRALMLVGDEDLDHVVGFVHSEDLLARSLGGSVLDREALRALARQPLFVPATMPVLQLVEAFRSSREHSALVLDEYGGVSGIVTLHDVLEELVGELPSPDEQLEGPPIVRREDGSWLVEGAIPIADLEEELSLDLSGGTLTDYQTLAGFVLARLGRLPKPGDHFVWNAHRFEVVDMDGRRIDKMLIAPARSGGVPDVRSPPA